MATGRLASCAAGMKDGGAFVRRETGQFEFLDGGGWHGGDLRPMSDVIRCQSACVADGSICGVVFELEREQLQRERVKTADWETGMNQLAQMRSEAGKFSVHAVLIHGWCSA